MELVVINTSRIRRIRYSSARRRPPQSNVLTRGETALPTPITGSPFAATGIGIKVYADQISTDVCGCPEIAEGVVEVAPGRAAGDILPIEGPDDREQDRVGGRQGKTLMLKNRYRYHHRRAERRPNLNRVWH